MSKQILTRLLYAIALLSVLAAADHDEHQIHRRYQDLRNEEGNFVVERFRRPNHTRNGFLAKQKVISKYKKLDGAMPSLLHRRGQTGHVTASPEEDYAEYICNVTIGNQQLIGMDLDSGSADFWVFSKYLSSDQQEAHQIYNPPDSPTFSYTNGTEDLSNSNFSVVYGDGSAAEGVVGYDKVVIGGATVTVQAIEMATAVTSNFVQDTDINGVLGLGFSIINSVMPDPQLTLFDNLLPTLSYPAFSVNFREDESGYYAFGSIPTSAYTGTLSSISIYPDTGYWAFISPIFTIGSKIQYNLNASLAIADTGTSLLVLDPNVVDAYYATIPGAVNDPSPACGGYCYPCNATLPVFGFSMGDHVVYVQPAQIFYAVVSLTNSSGTYKPDMCYGSIQNNLDSDGDSLGLQIFGEPFFRSAFVVFENSEELLGLRVGRKSASG